MKRRKMEIESTNTHAGGESIPLRIQQTFKMKIYYLEMAKGFSNRISKFERSEPKINTEPDAITGLIEKKNKV